MRGVTAPSPLTPCDICVQYLWLCVCVCWLHFCPWREKIQATSTCLVVYSAITCVTWHKHPWLLCIGRTRCRLLFTDSVHPLKTVNCSDLNVLPPGQLIIITVSVLNVHKFILVFDVVVVNSETCRRTNHQTLILHGIKTPYTPLLLIHSETQTLFNLFNLTRGKRFHLYFHINRQDISTGFNWMKFIRIPDVSWLVSPPGSDNQLCVWRTWCLSLGTTPERQVTAVAKGRGKEFRNDPSVSPEPLMNNRKSSAFHLVAASGVCVCVGGCRQADQSIHSTEESHPFNLHPSVRPRASAENKVSGKSSFTHQESSHFTSFLQPRRIFCWFVATHRLGVWH